MVIPVCIGCPIIFSVLKGFKLRVDLGTVCCTTTFLGIIIPYAIEVQPGQSIETRPAIEYGIHSNGLPIQNTSIIGKCCRKRFSVEKFFTSCDPNQNTSQQEYVQENFFISFHIRFSLIK